MEGFIKYIEKLISLTDEEKNYFQLLLKKKQLSKGEFFLKEKSIAGELAYVNEGFLRTFYYKDGDDVTTDLVGPDGFTTSFGCFISQVVSYENIIAAADCSLTLINYHSLQELYELNPKWNIIGRKIAEYSLSCRDNRVRSLLTLNAEERYNSLMERHPNFINHIPLNYIASYLGIRRETLSRIRNRTTF